MNELDFRNRTAVITGGAAGIGLAVAQRLAASGADGRALGPRRGGARGGQKALLAAAR